MGLVAGRRQPPRDTHAGSTHGDADAHGDSDLYTCAHGNPHKRADDDAYATGLGGTRVDNGHAELARGLTATLGR